jgi:DNA-binding NarL/FixJ family response regulator
VANSILIVDDNAIIRRALRTCFLTNVDWNVCGEAADGREAIEKAQELEPDLIVLDLTMPRMNGLEAARELKRLIPSVHLLMFTSFKTSTLEQQAISAGCAAVISKEELNVLVRSIQRLLGTPTAASVAAAD